MALSQFLDEIEHLSASGGSFKPHKYLLLLAVTDLVQSGQVNNNRFRYNSTLRDLFSSYFDRYHGPGDRDRPSAPFFHLQSSGFWHLRAYPGKEALLANLKTVGGHKELLEYVDYAELRQDVYEWLRDQRSASAITNRILTILQQRLGGNESQEQQLHETRAEYQIEHGNRSLFEHEERAIQAIRRRMPGRGRLLSNLEIHDQQSNSYYEYDVILAMRSGLYVVELKHWSGRVRVAPYQWVIDDYRYQRDPHLTNSFKCRLLKGLYEHRFPTFPRLWVESVVVLTNPDATVENADSPSTAATTRQHNHTFAAIDDLLSYLRRRDAAPEGQVLSDQEIAAVIEHLLGLVRPPRRNVYSISGHETVQFLFQRPDRIEMLARPVDGRTRGLTRFRIFRLPVAGTPEEKARAKRQALNTLDAVARIGEHPHIHRAWRSPSDEGDIIEGSDWSEAGTLQDLLADDKRELSTQDALEICRGLALGLSAAHEAGIIHRAVKPEHVLLMNGIPKLTDFDLSFDLGRRPDDITVLPSSTGLKDDGYTAPELLASREFDEGTDLFGLGVIAYQLLVGEKPFATAKQLLAQGGGLTDRQLRPLATRGLPQKAIAAIRRAVLADRRQRLRSARQMADAFSSDPAGDTQALVANARLQPGDHYDVYEILEFLGEGAEAQTYRARTVRAEQIALKLFHHEVPREAALRQQEYASSIASPHIVRADRRVGHWRGKRFFFVMEYVAGETLRERILRGDRPDAEAFRRVALGLMDALRAFHGHRGGDGEPEPLIHGDVKPDNILLAETGEPKLTDLSVAGPPRIDEFAGTVGYVPPDRILGAEMQFAADGDLFALGVTLWEWLFGGKPYASPAVGSQATAPGPPAPEFPAGWLRWLERAVATRESDRFRSVSEMRRAFEAAEQAEPQPTDGAPDDEIAPEPAADLAPAPTAPEPVLPLAEHSNPFVAYLRTLSNASAGNENATAEAQSLTPFSEAIHVRNPLTKLVLEQLVNERKNVILTGNAGDGKTTIAGEVYRKLTGRAMPISERVELPEQRLVIVKDMSELPADSRVQVIEQAAAGQDGVYLIVTNTGTLLRNARASRIGEGDEDRVESELLTALASDHVAPVLGDRFRLLNVGRTDSIDTACAVLRRMLAPDNWLACGGCRLSDHCPVLANVRLIRECEEIAVRRVELAYRRLYEYGVRLTMRQMLGHLAQALTAGWDCSQLHRLSQTALEECLPGSLFCNHFFGDDGGELLPEAAQLDPVRHLREAEFGVMLDPRLEREVWTKDELDLPLQEGALQALRHLRGRTALPSAATRRQVRRLVYFFGALEANDAGREYLSAFLRSPILLEYLLLVRGGGRIPPRQELALRCQVMQVLQEYYAAVPLPEGTWRDTARLYITLSRQSSGANTQVVLASLTTDEFRVAVEPGHRDMEGSSGRLVLRQPRGQARLPLDLPFLDYVSRRYEGEIAAQLSAFYADRLERFGAQLLSDPNAAADDSQELQLLRIGADRQLSRVRIHFAAERMEVVR